MELRRVLFRSWAVRSACLVPNVAYVDGLVSAKDHVATVDPPEGSSVAQGSVIKVNLSKGNEQTVPDVGGMTPEEAQRQLAGLGFTNIRRSPNINPPPDKVGKAMFTVPAAGTVAKT